MLFLYGGGGATVAHWVHAPETQFKSDDRTHNRTRNAWQGMFLPLVYRGIAQLVEQWSPKPRAEGSNPLPLPNMLV